MKKRKELFFKNNSFESFTYYKYVLYLQIQSDFAQPDFVLPKEEFLPDCQNYPFY